MFIIFYEKSGNRFVPVRGVNSHSLEEAVIQFTLDVKESVDFINDGDVYATIFPDNILPGYVIDIETIRYEFSFDKKGRR